jgi:hypothetical protein
MFSSGNLSIAAKNRISQKNNFHQKHTTDSTSCLYTWRGSGFDKLLQPTNVPNKKTDPTLALKAWPRVT